MVLAYILVLAKVYPARNPLILAPKKVPHEFQFESFYLRFYTNEGSQKMILNRMVLQSQKGLRVIFRNLSRSMKVCWLRSE